MVIHDMTLLTNVITTTLSETDALTLLAQLERDDALQLETIISKVCLVLPSLTLVEFKNVLDQLVSKSLVKRVGTNYQRLAA